MGRQSSCALRSPSLAKLAGCCEWAQRRYCPSLLRVSKSCGPLVSQFRGIHPVSNRFDASTWKKSCTWWVLFLQLRTYSGSIGDRSVACSRDLLKRPLRGHRSQSGRVVVMHTSNREEHASHQRSMTSPRFSQPCVFLWQLESY